MYTDKSCRPLRGIREPLTILRAPIRDPYHSMRELLRLRSRFTSGLLETPMSIYLDDLIETLEAEAKEGRVHPRKLEASSRFVPKNPASALKRTLQRLGTLRT